MNARAIILTGIFVLLLLQSGCKENPVEPVKENPASIVSGKVVSDSTGLPISNAVVFDRLQPSRIDTTDSQGDFSISFGVLTAQYNSSIITNAYDLGYSNDTTQISVEVGKNLTAPDVRLKPRSGAVIVYGSSGPAASIILVKQSAKTIALRGTGINESSTLTFRVLDSTGVPVVGVNRSTVNFSLTGPGAGEFLKPISGLTNATGEVTTTVSSGTAPGVLQVIASTRGDSVKATPIVLTAGGGFPDSAHVSIAATKYNIAGRRFEGISTSISLFVGDRFGNPVAEGTKVTFGTNAGLIPYEAATSKEGVATVNLMSGGASPEITRGIVTVTAKTSGDKSYRASDSLITQTIRILFSGATQYPEVDTVGFTVPDGGDFYFNVHVSDDYGNPLVAGSTITVSVKAAVDSLQKDLELSNNVKTLKDAVYSDTIFTVGVHDKGTVKGAGIITFGIDIKSENGDYSNSKWFTAYNSGSGTQTGTFNVPAKVEIADSSVNSLYLAESNILHETRKTLTFIVKDALNNPINAARRALVSFSFREKPNGMSLSRDTISTNSNGMASVDIISGDTAGTAQVLAQTEGESGMVQGLSLPILVARGLPDSNRIFLDIDKKNIFNKSDSKVGTVNVTLVDKDGYDAVPQKLTATTSAGDVRNIPTTVDGKTAISLYGSSFATDDPTPGMHNVRVHVPTTQGITVTKAQPFMFSYEPRILFTNTTIVDSSINALRDSLADNSAIDINYAIRDKNGNPISSGNKIKITVSGTAASELELSGDIDVTTTDTQNPTNQNYKFTIKNKAGGIQGAFTITITVTGESCTSDIVRTLTGYCLPTVSAEKIVLDGSPSRILNVYGSGTFNSTEVTFIVTNNMDKPIDGTNPVYVDLRVLDVLGGVSISPTRKQAGADGKVKATINAGTRYGKFRIQASFSNGVTTIYSPQETFSVVGPSANYFSLYLSKKNLPGVGIVNTELGKATVAVYDSVGNSLPTGTQVNFKMLNGGAIANPAYTNSNGLAITNIIGGSTPTDPARVVGYGNLQAWMIGNNGDTLKQTAPFLFSGVPKFIFFTKDGVTPTLDALSKSIADGGGDTVYFKIRDANWRPVSNDYAISVTVDGDSGALEVKNITVIRDIENMDDTTQVCSFQLADKIRGGGPSGAVYVTITVANNNLGSYSTTIVRDLLSPAGDLPSRAQQIKFFASSTSPLYVKSTGLGEATDLTFQLIDSSNHPVISSKADVVNFDIVNVTGGETLSDASKLSDANGLVKTTFHTGTKARPVIIRARIPSLNIEASKEIIVLGGFPTASNFTMAWNVTPPVKVINVPILGSTKEVASINFFLRDQYNNPVKPTTVEFESVGGTLVGPDKDKGYATTENGQTTATLLDTKFPTNGVGYAIARTTDGAGVYFSDSLQFIASGAPIIRTSVDTITLADGERNFAISYFVEDTNHHSLSGGTYKVDLDGPASPSIDLEGHKNVTLGSNEISPTTFHLLVHDNNSVPLSGWFKVRIYVTSPNGNTYKEIIGQLNGPVPADPTMPAKIVNAQGSPSISTLYVKSASTNTSSTITFQLKDSSDTPIDRARVTTVNFAFTGPGGDEYLSRTSGQTGENGLVSVVVNSGSKPGVIVVTANATVAGNPLPTCTVELSVKGAPDSTRSQIWLTKTNYPGLVPGAGTLGQIFVKLADEYGNAPIPSIVRFSSTSAMFGEDNPATTNASGEANVYFSGGGRSPVDGIDTLRMTTKGSNGDFTKLIPVLFSGTPIITLMNVPNDTVRITDGGTFEISYQVADINGNPISTDNQIEVSISGTPTSDIDVDGAKPVILDTQDKSLGTFFKVKFTDKVSGLSGKYGEFGVTIKITGKNAPTGISKTFLGVLQRPNDVGGGSSAYEEPSHAVVKSITPDNLAVNSASVKDNVSSTIVIEVRDKLDRPIDAKHSVNAKFSLSFYPNANIGGGTMPTISPATDTSNAEGQLRCIIVSGTQAGVVQLHIEITTKDSIQIPVMQPVALTINGGLADKGHFNVLGGRYVFPGAYTTEMIRITAVVGDTFSNPVRINTPVYFHSQAGVITTGSTYDKFAYTDKFGNASVMLNKGANFGYVAGNYDPTYGPGYFWVYAQTEGNNHVQVIDSLLLVWAIGPVQIFGLPDTISFLRGESSAPISIRITDGTRNPMHTDSIGNPLPDGTKITTTVEFNSDIPGLKFGVSGDLNSVDPFVMPNEAYARFPAVGVTDFTFVVSDLSSTPVGLLINVNITVEAPNMVKLTRSLRCLVQ